MTEVKIVDYKQFAEKIRNIRDDVFIKEQGVPPEIEVDGLDAGAIHAVAYDSMIEIGTGRMLPDGHIGRIAVRKSYRGKGIGKIIMQSLLAEAKKRQLTEVWLSAQYHAKGFYEKLGFRGTGDIYREADIDHLKMRKKL